MNDHVVTIVVAIAVAVMVAIVQNKQVVLGDVVSIFLKVRKSEHFGHANHMFMMISVVALII